jgi:hypothetical protein
MIFDLWLYVIGIVMAGTGLVFVATLFIRIASGVQWVFAAAFAGIVAVGILMLCCSVGNTALIIFLKRLVMQDWPPHRMRVTLTLVSFFYTLVTHWWTLILAPVIALFIAYRVYHTLALPDGYSDKAKRKEVMSDLLEA